MPESLAFTLLLILFHSQLFVCGLKEIPMAVAFYCGRPALYLTANGWEPDQFVDCLQQKKDIVSFCRRVYPNANITDASFSPVIDVQLRGWCHQANSSCSDESSVYRIQPWICSVRRPLLIVPPGCQSKEFGGVNNATCQKSEYWKQVAGEYCLTLQQVEFVKPCIKPDSYLHTHFLGVLAVCCGNKNGKLSSPADIVVTPPPIAAIQSFEVNHSFPFPALSEADDSLVIDQNVALYQGYLSQQVAITTKRPIAAPSKSRERQQYNVAKKAGHEAYHRRKHILEQELAEAESQLSNEDWIRNPEQTQVAENRLHKEFRRKYLALDQEARATDHELLVTHQQRTSHAMGKRFEAAALAWDKAVRSQPSNLTQLLSAIEHLQRVVERDRYHFIRRWEHLEATDPAEASRTLSNLRERLDEMEKQFNRSLEKLDQVPILKDAILHHVAQLRDREYPQLDAMVRSLHHMAIPESDGFLFPTPDQQAALEAESIISKYRHHLPKLDLDNKSSKVNRTQDNTNLAPKTIQIGEVTNIPTEKRNQNANQLTPSFKTVAPRTYSDVAPSPAFEVLLTNQTQPVDSVEKTVTSPRIRGISTVSKWLLSLAVVAGVLVVTFFALRYRIRRARLRRAGYSCTVAEVDEITNVDAIDVDQSLDLRDDESDRLTSWRFNGYENPAYKYPDNVIRFPRS